MIISDKFIFSHVPRTGGTSIHSILSNYGETPTSSDFPHPIHVPWKFIAEMVNLDDYFTFCFIRNPWDRTLSQYTNYMSSPSRINKYLPFVMFCNVDTCTDLIYPNTKARSMGGIRNFYDFVHVDGKLVVDKIYRYEELRLAWGVIQYRLGIKKALPRLNSTNHTHYRDYYNDETKNIIAEKYKWAIDYFGYTF